MTTTDKKKNLEVIVRVRPLLKFDKSQEVCFENIEV